MTIAAEAQIMRKERPSFLGIFMDLNIIATFDLEPELEGSGARTAGTARDARFNSEGEAR
ncbi:hypothetical protein [Allosphingosinicella deserti]|uniref:hypothetical protein n=1 Tax=Allosphingosinicella deserti TaxID=2116704 RepID=UPI0018EDC866|nr:hypothetical protein [Sphingomonas deserti]